MDEIAVLCDLRQGAVNDSLPFTNNPLKRPLHLEMMERGLLRVTILRVGPSIASAHLDVKDGDDVLLYLAAHAPRFARHSPGSLHILLLARATRDRGSSALRPVARRRLQGPLRRPQRDHLRAKRPIRARGSHDLGPGWSDGGRGDVHPVRGGADASVRARDRAGRPRGSGTPVQATSGQVGPRAKSVVFELPDLPDFGVGSPLALDRLGDLLGYRPEGPGQPSIDMDSFGWRSIALRAVIES